MTKRTLHDRYQHAARMLRRYLPRSGTTQGRRCKKWRTKCFRYHRQLARVMLTQYQDPTDPLYETIQRLYSRAHADSPLNAYNRDI